MLYIDNIANGRGSNASFEMSADITEDKSTHCIKCKMLSDWPPVAQVCVCVCVCVKVGHQRHYLIAYRGEKIKIL